jgi:hypothetical protein
LPPENFSKTKQRPSATNRREREHNGALGGAQFDPPSWRAIDRPNGMGAAVLAAAGAQKGLRYSRVPPETAAAPSLRLWLAVPEQVVRLVVERDAVPRLNCPGGARLFASRTSIVCSAKGARKVGHSLPWFDSHGAFPQNALPTRLR